MSHYFIDEKNEIHIYGLGLSLWCLTSLSTIFHAYLFTVMKQFTNMLYNQQMEGVIS
jgi:hypothetical protein